MACVGIKGDGVLSGSETDRIVRIKGLVSIAISIF